MYINNIQQQTNKQQFTDKLHHHMIFRLKQCFPRIFFLTNIALQSNGKPICCSLTGTSWYLKRGFLFSSWYKGHIGDSNYHTSGIHKNKLGSYVNGLQSSTRRNFASKLWLSLTNMSIQNGESDQQTVWDIWVWINTYRYITIVGYSHPF